MDVKLGWTRTKLKRVTLPMPPPAWGGAPKRKESMYALIFSKSEKENGWVYFRTNAYWHCENNQTYNIEAAPHIVKS